MSVQLSADASEIGYAVVLRQALGAGREVSIQFNMGLGADAKTWNAELDKLTGVLDRQVARAQLPERIEELKAQELVREIVENDIVKLQKSLDMRTSNPEIKQMSNPAAEVAKIAAQKEVLEKTDRKIEEMKAIIAELKKKAA